MTILKSLAPHVDMHEAALQFFHGWRLTAQNWLDEGKSREQIAIDLVLHVGPKMTRNILGEIK